MRAFFVVSSTVALLSIACGSTINGSDADGGGTDTNNNQDDGGSTQNQTDGGTGTPDDSGTPIADGATVGAGHSADLVAGMPRVVQADKAGTVLATPTIVAMTYDNDTNRADIEAFFPAFGASTAWAEVTKEYGVGALTFGTPIHVTGNAPVATTDAKMQAVLKANQATFDPNTVYMMFLPNGTIVDDGTGSKCCTDYDGYHADFVTGGQDVVYAIMCNCPGFDGPKVSNLQQLTVVASHETVEAVTDPHNAHLAFAQPDNDHLAWGEATGGETADMCSFADTAYWIPKDMKYMVQRSWSNAAMSIGQDPCVGDPQAVYYNTIPELSDSYTPSDYGIATKSIKVPLGTTATLKLKIFSNSDNGAEYNVTVEDFNSAKSTYLSVVNSKTTYKSGDEISVQITPNKSNAAPLTGAELFQVATTPTDGTSPTTYFYGLVSQ